MAIHSTQRGAGGVAWLTLVAAVVALILGLVAFNRTSKVAPPAMEEEKAQESPGIVERSELAAKRAEAVASLLTIQAKLKTGETYEDAHATVQSVRAKLAAQYEGASAAAQDQWQKIEADFDQLEAQLRDKSANALGTLEQLIARLRADVQK